MYVPKIDDKIIIRKPFCTDNIYIGLKGKIIKIYKGNFNYFAVKIKVDLPIKDDKYFLGDTPIFPLYCLEKIEEI